MGAHVASRPDRRSRQQSRQRTAIYRCDQAGCSARGAVVAELVVAGPDLEHPPRLACRVCVRPLAFVTYRPASADYAGTSQVE